MSNDDEPVSPPTDHSRPVADLGFSHVRRLPNTERGHRLTLTVHNETRELLAEFVATYQSLEH